MAGITRMMTTLAKGPSVSVVIPIHNRAHFISTALGTILNQTYIVDEIIVVDDCSTDDLECRLQEQKCSIVKLICLPLKSNAAVARNTGAAAARGDYVAFLDSDDVWATNHLASKIELLSRNPSAHGAYGNFFATYGGKPIRRSRLRPLSDGIAVAEQIFGGWGTPRTSTFVLNRKSFLDVQFDQTLSKHQDWDLFIRFAERFPVCFDSNPTVHLETRHPGRMSASSVHEGTHRFLCKHKAKLSPKTLGRLYSGIAMTTFLSEGPSKEFYEYYNGIPWHPSCGARVLARKAALGVPGSYYLIAGVRRIFRLGYFLQFRLGNLCGKWTRHIKRGVRAHDRASARH